MSFRRRRGRYRRRRGRVPAYFVSRGGIRL